MSKGLKIALFAGLPLLLILGLGAAWGLAKIGVIPTRKFAEKNKLVAKGLKILKLDSPKLPTRTVEVTPPPDPLAPQKKALEADKAALDEERAKWEKQKQTAQKAEETAKQAAIAARPDPKELGRLAAVYEGMPADKVTQIFAKLPDDHVIALLRRMEEKQVGAILTTVAPDRAARLTLALSRPPVTASAAP